MKKWLFGAVLVAVAISGAQASAWKVVRFGVEGTYPPFSWTEPDGSLKGFDVDLAYALCQEMQVKCKIVPHQWDGIIPSLLARKYDAIIAAMSITDERRKKVNFTHRYALIPNRFIAKKGTILTWTKAGLQGISIGVRRSTTHDNYLTDRFGDDVNIVRYGAPDDAYRDLMNGRIQVMFGDAAVLEEGLLKQNGGDAYAFVGPSLTDPKWFGEGFGIATRKQDRELTEKLNQAIDALRANGEYKKIEVKYFNYDVYGD